MVSENLTKTERVGAYIRLSKEDEGNKKESESITNQKEYITEYANRNGFCIHDFYVDDGYSGGNFDRPNFKRLISDIECGVIDTVITKDTSRLGRDFVETGFYMFKYFPENNIRYIAILENFDTEKPNGVEDIIPFQTVINDMYLKDISRKIKSVRQNKMKQGLFVGSTVSYGYKRDDEDPHKFVIDDYSADIVRRIFDMRLNGMTSTMIARTLTEEGIEPPNIYNSKKIKETYTANIWKLSSISHILSNEIYIGTLVQRKYDKINYKSKKKVKLPEEQWIKVEKFCEPIISKELFESVQKQKQVNGKLTTRKYDYLLKGLVVCAECGGKLNVRRSYKKNKKKPTAPKPYYCCKNNISYRNGVCTLHYFQEKKLNEIVINHLRDIFSLYNKRELLEDSYITKRKIKSDIEKFEKELNSYKKRISVIEKALSDLCMDRANGILSNDDFYKIKSGLDKDRAIVADKIKDIETMLVTRQTEQNSEDNKDEIIERFLKIKNPDKQMMNELIKKIEIDEQKNVKIYFNFNIKEPVYDYEMVANG